MVSLLKKSLFGLRSDCNPFVFGLFAPGSRAAIRLLKLRLSLRAPRMRVVISDRSRRQESRSNERFQLEDGCPDQHHSNCGPLSFRCLYSFAHFSSTLNQSRPCTSNRQPQAIECKGDQRDLFRRSIIVSESYTQPPHTPPLACTKAAHSRVSSGREG